MTLVVEQFPIVNSKVGLYRCGQIRSHHTNPIYRKQLFKYPFWRAQIESLFGLIWF